MPHLLILGYGYSARRIGSLLLARGWTVTGTRRTVEGAEELASDGVTPLVFDGDGPSAEVASAVKGATHLLASAPPGEHGDPLLHHHRADVVASSSLGWLGYLSTTGVYGDHGGAAVTEATPPAPSSERAKRRLQAEEEWERVAAELGAALQIFRLSGIYGPGRSTLDRLREGTARRVVAPELVFNRIHVDDIAGAVLAGMDHPERPGIYNVSDDLPAPPARVVEYGAELLGIEPPPETRLEDADLSAAARSFYEENKRVDNTRLRDVLGYRLRHPTYREGLDALWSGGDRASGP